MIRKFLLVAVSATALGLASTASAATPTQGDLGATSTGTFSVNAELPKLVRVSGLTDYSHTFTAAEIQAAVNLGIANCGVHNSPGGNCYPVILETKNFCVYSNDGTAGNYTITFSGLPGLSGDNENFRLDGGSSSHIAMRVGFSGNGGYPNQVPNGSAVTGQSTAAGNSGNRVLTMDCDGGAHNDAKMLVQFPNVSILAATAGSYSGVITVTVSPT